jgi:hypothetical protein
VLGVELLMMVLRRATTLRATRLQVEAEAAQEAAMTAPLHRIQIEAMRRPRRAEEPPRPAAPAPARPAPALADGREPRRAPSDTFRQAVAAAKGEDDSRPRRRQAPYMVAAAILDERADAGTLTPAQLVEAMAERGVTISQSTAQALLRELRSPLSTRMSNRRPARAAGTLAGDGGRPAARPRQ